MKYKTTDDTCLHYSQTGKDSPSLIFLHGLNANNTIWKDVVTELTYRTFCLDLRGHGKSDKPYKQEKYSIERLVRDVEELKKKQNIERYVLIGHSFGGMIAMKHSINNGGADGLILMSTSSNITPTFIEKKFGKNILERIKEKIEKIERVVERTNRLDMESYGDTYKVWMEELLSMTPHAALSCIETILDINMTDNLVQITPPVKILHGKKDEIVSFEEAEKLCENIPQAKLTPIEEGFHQPMLDHPHKIAKSIETFIEELSEK